MFSSPPPLSFGDEFLSLAMLREGRTVGSPSWRDSLCLLFRMFLKGIVVSSPNYLFRH